MAQIPFRANTQSSFFPLLSRQASQTIISGESDQTYVPNVNPQDSTSPVERGIPQILYGHNIMPSTYGYQSVGYTELYKGLSGDINIDEVILVVSREKTRTYIAVDYTHTKNIYVLDGNNNWVVPTNAPQGYPNKDRKISVATVNGESVIHVPGAGSYFYEAATVSFQWRELTGLDQPAVEGLVTANGYLIAWSKTGYSWSATNDPYDFTPSDVSGAGGGDSQDAKGDITYCQATSYGFIVYTTNNAIGVLYSGNSDYPFNPREIASAGGVRNKDYVSVQAAAAQYAYTSNGLQTIAHSGAKTIMPALTDFLAGQVVEDFNDITKEFYVNEFDTPMRKKIALVCDRYLVCSYGANPNGEMTHALVVDIIQSRLGKLRITHNACFEHLNTVPEEDDTPRRSIAFVDRSGRVQLVDFSTNNSTSKGTVIYGKYQLLRGNYINLQRVEIENIPDDKCEITALMSYDGKNFTRKEGLYLDKKNSEHLIKSYYTNIESKNISLLIQGQFEINGLIMFFNLGGSN